MGVVAGLRCRRALPPPVPFPTPLPLPRPPLPPPPPPPPGRQGRLGAGKEWWVVGVALAMGAAAVAGEALVDRDALLAGHESFDETICRTRALTILDWLQLHPGC